MEDTVEFLYLWPCKISEWTDKPVESTISSPSFRMVYNGIGFDWHLDVYPKGVRESSKEYLGLFLCFDGSASSDCSIEIEDKIFVKFNAEKKNESKWAKELFEIPNGYCEWGSEKFLKISNQTQIESDYCVDGVITFGVILKIPKQEFSPSKLLPDMTTQNLTGRVSAMFSAVECVAQVYSDPPPNEKMKQASDENSSDLKSLKRPSSDEFKVLDFRILTSDSYVIWCHKVVLVTSNERFATLLRSNLKESEDFVKVSYPADIMMEVLHNIYKQAPSPKFQDLVLNDIADAANDYDLSELKLRCQKQFISQLSVQNSAELLELADRYGMMVLKNMAINLITENQSEVWRSEKGKEMRESLWLEVMEASDKIRRVVSLPFGS